MPMKGVKAHIARLNKLAGPLGTRDIGRALFAGGELITVEAQISITNGAVSGKGHVASLPGEAPNADTHDLANRIETVQRAPLVVEVQSTSDHARLEWEWGNVAERPYLRPARDKMKPQVKALVEKALNKVVRASRSTAKD